ncbi:single-stranded-DNA-specific exonuclease RecJ [Clostridium folliculivorans]|uniref:Single-stranded-DNA-specific exonuclease RecJ n=1 Tax=Clostridium folliculivorans TaxID=2886038 RepID=A0A9W5XYW6_9CLOT|nr:single-stranded-DNA-specific exonuclease RecJ [Clostridium folliculivorans]GKU23533.1 single-stranded-DNA-specific exonuclease RecJ [Clostridium folliculivorans]GKU29649.1 single-stranded-DNA-specific exonuclease RecJ [Clostridium folliculivorans]
MSENWLLINKGIADANKLIKELNISQFTARLLVNRDITNVKQAEKFLYGELNDLYDGHLMKDMDKAVDMIKLAIENNRKIIIYGDYDCDGVNSTVILNNALKNCNANYNYYIPNREDEGYGMNSNRIRKLKEEGYELILTCDNGIAAFEQVDLAKSLGMDVIITDHHDIPIFKEDDGTTIEKFPDADAVVNPKRNDCKYPFKKLCGAGVAFKLVQCLYEALGIPKNNAYDLLEFAAIATVCDVVDLIDENRILVKEGLKRINNTKNIGLKALMKQTNLEGKVVGAYHLGFIIGPCVNATGRLETADLSVELLITNENDRASELAKELHELNQRRQEMTTESVELIEDQIVRNHMEKDKVLVVYNDRIHESIAGIVAGRIREKYNVPALILTQGKEMAKGSGRSIEEYNMFEELSSCKELLDKFGGHPMAAGLSVKEENIPKLRVKLLQSCKLKDEDIVPKVRIDLRLPLAYVNEQVVDELEKLEPFGKGNNTPLFGEKSVETLRIWTIGKEKNILKFRFKMLGSNYSIDGICFNKYEEFKEQFIDKYGENEFLSILDTSFCDFKMDFLFYPSINEYNGNRSIQAIIKSIRL